MKEQPILFSGPMVRAIIEGRKTTTRRVMKPQPSAGMRWGFEGWEDGHGREISCSYGQPGDRLWVRETWTPGYAPTLIESEGDDETSISIIYQADLQELYRPVSEELAEDWGDFTSDGPDAPRWRPSIHMPRWACRLILEVTAVRVERIQDISEEDAKAEGIIELSNCTPPNYSQTDKQYSDGTAVGFTSATAAFRSLWDSINAKRGYGWDANPWVWVVEFRPVEARGKE